MASVSALDCFSSADASTVFITLRTVRIAIRIRRAVPAASSLFPAMSEL